MFKAVVNDAPAGHEELKVVLPYTRALPCADQCSVPPHARGSNASAPDAARTLEFGRLARKMPVDYVSVPRSLLCRLAPALSSRHNWLASRLTRNSKIANRLVTVEDGGFHLFSDQRPWIYQEGFSVFGPEHFKVNWFLHLLGR